jgi:hypothetical protein
MFHADARTTAKATFHRSFNVPRSSQRGATRSRATTATIPAADRRLRRAGDGAGVDTPEVDFIARPPASCA